jgi:hypothetical protein
MPDVPSENTYALLGWVAWYSGNRTFHSDSTSWEQLPNDGAIAFMLFFDAVSPEGTLMRRIMINTDHYFLAMTPEGPIYGNSNDPIDTILQRYPGAQIKLGQFISDPAYYAIEQEAWAYTWP